MFGLVTSRYSMVIAFTMLLGAAFKLTAFGREMFITSRFGLSAATDAYFSLQQLPLAVASFMFGPFCRAFTPAYADSRRTGSAVEWLPGLLLYATVFGCLLTAVSIALAPVLLRLFLGNVDRGGWSTLAVVSLCYLPIILIGLFAGIATSYGRNLSSLTITGLPYLLMSATLGVFYLAGHLATWGLPVSLTAGFALTGVLATAGILGMRNRSFIRLTYFARGECRRSALSPVNSPLRRSRTSATRPIKC